MDRFSRRKFLRGTGATLLLPLLETFIPDRVLAAGNPKRFVALFFPMGKVGHGDLDWIPTSEGANYGIRTNTLLSPLGAVKSSVSVISGVRRPDSRGGASGHHFESTSNWLTGRVCAGGMTPISGGVSADMLIKDFTQSSTPMKHLAMATKLMGYDDEGYSRVYAQTISWNPDLTPVPLYNRPLEIFNAIVNAAPTYTNTERIYRKGVVDIVLQDAHAMRRKLSRSDQLKVDEYLTAVHELEAKITALPDAPPPACTPGTAPPSSPSFEQKVPILLDLIDLAFRCDRVRTISYVMDVDPTNQEFPWIGVNDGHHSVSHYARDNAFYAPQHKAIQKWYVEKFVYLINKLKNRADIAGGNVLDNTAVLFGSGIGQSDSAHLGTNLPCLLGGGSAVGLQPGRHINAGGVPIANLLLHLLNLYGSTATSFGNSNGRLTAA